MKTISMLEFRRNARRALDAVRGEERPVLTYRGKPIAPVPQIPGPGVSFTDCSSFVVMRERGIEDAVTTDNHFRVAGVRSLPGRARRQPRRVPQDVTQTLY